MTEREPASEIREPEDETGETDLCVFCNNDEVDFLTGTTFSAAPCGHQLCRVCVEREFHASGVFEISCKSCDSKIRKTQLENKSKAEIKFRRFKEARTGVKTAYNLRRWDFGGSPEYEEFTDSREDVVRARLNREEESGLIVASALKLLTKERLEKNASVEEEEDLKIARLIRDEEAAMKLAAEAAEKEDLREKRRKAIDARRAMASKLGEAVDELEEVDEAPVGGAARANARAIATSMAFRIPIVAPIENYVRKFKPNRSKQKRAGGWDDDFVEKRARDEMAKF